MFSGLQASSACRIFSRLQLSASLRYWLLILVVLLNGCSDDVRPQPAELAPFEPTAELIRNWKVSIGSGNDGKFLQISPFIDENHVFAANYSGTLLKIGATTGLHLWQTDIGEPLIGGVGGDDLQVYVTTVNGELVAIDREQGSERWRTPVAGEVLAPPVSYLGRVIVNTINGRIAAYASKDGTRVWEYASSEPSLTLRGTSRPVPVKDAVITGQANGTVAALSLEEGQLYWEQRVAAAKGKTELERLIDVDGNVVVDDNALFAVAFQGRLAKLGLFNGREQWSLPISSRTTPAVDFSRVYISTTEGDVVAIDKVSQQEIWRQSALAFRELTAPVSWRNFLLVGDLEGYVHLLSKTDGRFLARIKPAKKVITVEPYIYQDRFIVLGSDGLLSAWTIAANSD